MTTLIEKLEQVKEKNKDNFNKTGDRDYAVAIGVTQHCINIVKQHSDWISVDERLPADNEEVLTYWSDGDVVIAYFMKGRFSFSDCSGEIITHWQPLPQPPSEVQNV